MSRATPFGNLTFYAESDSYQNPPNKEGVKHESEKSSAWNGPKIMPRFLIRPLCHLPILAFLWIISFPVGGQTQTMKDGNVRESILAGSWYPDSPAELSKEVQGLLSKVPSQSVKGKIIAIISPHAGYRYSGWVAAYGYRLIQDEKFDCVILIGPSHRASFKGVSIYPKGGYRTPLGVVPIDEVLSGEIMKKSHLISSIPEIHIQEHSLEIQLPFLQEVLRNFKIIPMIMGDQSWDTCVALSKAIASSIGGLKVLIVASSDLSHYHSYDEAVDMDGIVLNYILNMDPKGLNQDLLSGRCEACGGGPIIATMLAAQILGANKAKILKYGNSGDVTGAKNGVVGYASAVFLQNPGKGEKDKVGCDLGLTEEEKKFLHHIAKTVIERRLKGQEIPRFDSPTETLKEPRGAFVTLNKHGGLRGCIGYIRGYKPLYEAVAEMAEAAAFRDPRFMPLTQDELKDIEIEISVLTPLEKIADIGLIEVGRHGLYVERGPFSGLLLPQVATEFGWDRITFLEETCRKAGLPKDAWKEQDTVIYIFSADIF